MVARRAIHAASDQVYDESVTTDAVAGGTSAKRAIGSALSTQSPWRDSSWNLYAVPTPRPGTKSSHTPLLPMERIACEGPSHWLKSPTTRTARAFGAHTVNHLFLPSQPDDAVERELRGCRQLLERLLDAPVTAVAYPYGGVTAAVATTAAVAGYTCGVTVHRGVVSSQSDVMLLPRIEVSADTNLDAELSEVFAAV